MRLVWSTHVFFESLNASLAPLLDEESVAQRGRTRLSSCPHWNPAPIPPTGSDSRLPHSTPPWPWQWPSRNPDPSPTTDILPAASTPRIPCCQLPASASEQAAFQPIHGSVSLYPMCHLSSHYIALGLLDTLALEIVNWLGFARSLFANLIH